jgi:hypothetical protein
MRAISARIPLFAAQVGLLAYGRRPVAAMESLMQDVEQRKGEVPAGGAETFDGYLATRFITHRRASGPAHAARLVRHVWRLFKPPGWCRRPR